MAKRSNAAYFEKLKDPRWQKRRLEIFKRDEFCCTSCLSGSETLHIHHRYYDFNLEPWDYPDDALTTLCEDCHDVVTPILKEVRRRVGDLHPYDLEVLK